MDELRRRDKALNDGIEEQAVVALPTASAQHADACLYAGAGAKITPLLGDAITTCNDAAKAALLQYRMAEAAMAALESRLRSLGAEGIFHAIDTDDLKTTGLDHFNQRSLW